MRRVFTVMGRELRVYFATPIAYIFLVIYLVATQGIFFFTYFDQGEADMRWILYMQPVVMLFLIPAITMRAWAEEKKVGTMELLMTLPVPDFEVVLGKFLACWAFWGIILVSTIAIPITVYSTVDSRFTVDAGPLIGGYVGLLLLGGVYIAICLFASSLTENQIIAFILGFIIVGILVFLGFILFAVPAWMVKPLNFIGLWTSFNSISRGLIDTRNVIYYLSLMVFFMYLNTIMIESRKWK